MKGEQVMLVKVLLFLTVVLATKRRNPFADRDQQRAVETFEFLQKEKRDLLTTYIPESSHGRCRNYVFKQKANALLNSWNPNEARALWIWCTDSGVLYSQGSVGQAWELFKTSITEKNDFNLLKESIESQNIEMYRFFVTPFIKKYGLGKLLRPGLKEALAALQPEDWEDGSLAMFLSAFLDNYQVILRPELYNNVILSEPERVARVKLLALLSLFPKQQLLDRLQMKSLFDSQVLRDLLVSICQANGIDLDGWLSSQNSDI